MCDPRSNQQWGVLKQRSGLETLHDLKGKQVKVNRLVAMVGKVLVGAGVVSLLQVLHVLPARAETFVLGVVRNSDNASEWSSIVERLRAAGLPYCAIDLEQVQSEIDLAGPTVLFLPNIETLTPGQVGALRMWMKQGGRVIASGPVGTLSQPAVRQQLQLLLGAYWGFSLNRSAALQLIETRSQQWNNSTALIGTASGGVVIPTALDSQTAATWQSTDNPPAVVVTEKATFLGWRWGAEDAASVDLDRVWLQAALSRYGEVVPAGAGATGKCAPAAVAPSPVATAPSLTPAPSPAAIAPSPTPIVPAPGTLPDAASLQSTPPDTTSLPTLNPSPRRATPPNPATLPGRPASPSTNPIILNVPQPRPTAATSPASSAPPATSPAPTASPAPAPSPTPAATPSTERESILARVGSQQPPLVDPTSRVFSPTLEVEPGDRPIARLQSIAMRQEIKDLLGRVESARLAANAANSSTDLRVTGNAAAGERSDGSDPRIAGTKGAAGQIARDRAASTELEAAIAAARQLLEDWPQLIAQRNYATARQQWLQVRQALWDSYPLDRPLAQPEIRALWLDRGSIVRAGSKQGLARIFDRLEGTGINTVFFETINAGYPIYPSQVAFQQNPLIKGWDPLKAAIELAHERQIELHAWMWTFAVSNPRHNTLVGLSANYPGPVLAVHPDWAGTDRRGYPIHGGSGKRFLDPANPEARRYLLQLIDEITTNYDVDGLQLDYIRYPFQDPSAGYAFGYGPAARQQFQDLTGVDPLSIAPRDRDLWQEWTQFRTEKINTFVAEVAQLARQKRPNIILSAAVFPFPEYRRIHRLQQHWEAWSRNGDIDLVLPMTYGFDTNGFQRVVRPLLETPDPGTALLSPAIRLLDMPDILAVDQVQAMRDLATSGYGLFAFENLNDNLHNIFSNTQGTTTGSTQDPIPYRQPFLAASARYAALQREWSYLLAQNQLQLRRSELEDWRNQAETVEQSLKQLAANPSAANFSKARTALNAFQAKFKHWMQLQAIENAYQVESWKNRLGVLSNLLQYGERTVLQKNIGARPYP